MPETTAASAGADSFDALIVLRTQADLGPAARLSQRGARGAYVAGALRRVAERSRGELVAALAARGVQSRALWIVNAISARLDPETAALLAAHPAVARIVRDEPVRAALPEPERALAPRVATAPEPNLLHSGADALWSRGITGQGVIVGNADTGFAWQHPALLGSYRGSTGGGPSHDYAWYDAVHDSVGNPCGNDSPVPCDDHGHGTHTLGILVGDDGGANRVGMAPGARWMGCRAMDQGWGTTTRYLECLQFFLAPTDRQGNDPRPDLAPHVVSLSWACIGIEGCDPDNLNVLRSAVENLRTAGILVVVAAGNEGSGCETVQFPPAIYEDALSVGATGRTSDTIASFSSRGPVTADGSGRLKPDLVAPGVSIRSSYGAGYASLSGTSMAAPHVAGMAALLMASAPTLRGAPGDVEDLLLETAAPQLSSQGCGGLPPTAVPNHVYGSGALRASVPILLDGFESGTTARWHP